MVKIKKYILGPPRERLNLGTTIIELVFPTKNIDIVPVYLIMCGRLKIKKGIDPILKWEVVKRCRRYRASDRDCMLCKEEKLAIASNNNGDMLNQRSEILKTCRHKRS